MKNARKIDQKCKSRINFRSESDKRVPVTLSEHLLANAVDSRRQNVYETADEEMAKK